MYVCMYGYSTYIDGVIQIYVTYIDGVYIHTYIHTFVPSLS